MILPAPPEECRRYCGIAEGWREDRGPLRWPPVPFPVPSYASGMPWSAGDVERHFKGASPHEKHIWVAAANNALSEYGNEGQAIRTANAAVDKHRSGSSRKKRPSKS